MTSQLDKLRDFRVFLVLVWRTLGLPDPTPLQLDIANRMQHGPSRQIIEAFRGIGKSWIASAYVLWLLLFDPDHKALVVSASKERADNFTTFALRLLREVELLNFLLPRNEQRNSKISFDVGPAKPDHSPSVKSVGVFGQLTGTRADIIIADDVEVSNNSLTHGLRYKLSERVKEFDAILKPGGRIIYLGTPQSEQSLYNELPARGYSPRLWPTRYPDERLAATYGENLAPVIRRNLEDKPYLVGMPTDPRRFDNDDLIKRELSYGRAGFALQFMLDTSLTDADRHPLKLRDLIVLDADLSTQLPEKLAWASSPELRHEDLPCVGLASDFFHRPMMTAKTWLDYTGSVLAIDPAGRGKDETSYAVVKMLNGYLVVTDVGGMITGYSPETLDYLVDVAKRNKVNAIVVESNFGDGMFTALLKPVLNKTYPCAVEEIRSNKQKELRIIDVLEPVMSNHRLVVPAEVIRRDFKSTESYQIEASHMYQLFWQMSRITRDRGALAHDDRLDALAMAVKYWTDQMAQDVDKNVHARQVELLENELEVFTKGVSRPLRDAAMFETIGFPMGDTLVIGLGTGVTLEGDRLSQRNKGWSGVQERFNRQ